nr:hypothetical protein [Tanacetum cinerariifolium]
MGIEQYFLMTNYSLWEVIIKGDSPSPTVVVDGVVQPVTILSADQKLARRNELKARGTLLMALPDKHQLKFNSQKDAKTLMEAIEKRFGGNTETKKIHDRLQKLVSQLEIHGVSVSQEDVNLNTTDSVSATTSVSAVCVKLPVSSHLNIDSLSNAVIFLFFDSQSTSPQLDNEDLKQIDTNDKHGLGYFSSKGDFEILSTSSSSDKFQPSGGYHAVPPPITGTFMPPKHDLVFHTAPIAVETDHSAFTVQLSPAKPAEDLSHTTTPMAPISKDWVSDSEDEYEPNDPQSVPSFVQNSKHVKPSGHSVQPVKAHILAATPKLTGPKTNSSGKRKNRKTCFVCRSVEHLIKDCNFYAKTKAQPISRNYAHRGYNKQKASFTQKHPQKHIVPAAVLTKSKPVYVTAVRPVSAIVSKITMTRPKHAHSIDTKSKSTFRRHITRSQSPKTSKSPPKVTAAKASVVSAATGKKGKWVWRPKCLILDHDSRTTSASM